MANNTISQIEVNGITYDLLDANTLSAVSALNQRVTSLESSVSPKAVSYTNSFGSGISGSGVQSAVKIAGIVFVKFNIAISTLSWTTIATGLPTPNRLFTSGVVSYYSSSNGTTVGVGFSGNALVARSYGSESLTVLDTIYIYPCA